MEGEGFSGAGIYADVTLRFEDGLLRCFLNGRIFDETAYDADRNADPEDRVIETKGFRCRDGMIRSLRFSEGWRRDDRLTAELVFPDGTAKNVCFHTGSEETLYFDLSGEFPRFPAP